MSLRRAVISAGDLYLQIQHQGRKRIIKKLCQFCRHEEDNLQHELC